MPISFADTQPARGHEVPAQERRRQGRSVSPARAYKLAYATSPRTGPVAACPRCKCTARTLSTTRRRARSSGGTTLPPQVFGYSDDPIGRHVPILDVRIADARTHDGGSDLDAADEPRDGGGSTLTKTEGINGDCGTRVARRTARSCLATATSKCTASQGAMSRLVGLSNGNTDVSIGDVDFAVHSQGPGRKLYIFESGVLIGPSNLTRAAGDILRDRGCRRASCATEEHERSSSSRARRHAVLSASGG